MPAKQQHTHKFKRLRYKSGNEIFFCTLPDCNVKMNPALAFGKRCICWRCGDDFLLDEYALRLAKPHCESCHRPKGVPEKLDDITLSAPEPISAFTYDDDKPLTLTERLQQTIQQAVNHPQNQDEEI
jgi:hypothetical protein